MDPKKKSSAVNPEHYNRFEIEPYEFISKNKLSYGQGNVIKYTCRYKHKNGREDLEKAKVYINFLIKELEDAKK
tara:strand:+ start:577 stop:798 length:222 start_codon:yes stop_codon:yes gene_type:complete